MFNKCKHSLLAAALLLLCGLARAADTDIYIGAYANDDSGNPVGNTNPNIMIVIDNSSNWSGTFNNSAPACSGDKTKFCNEILALKTVIGGLGSTVNVGLSMFAETGANGAYVRFAARPMNDTNKAKLLDILNGLIRNGSGSDSSGSNQPYGYAMFEMFKYFGGYTNPAKAATDTAGSPVGANGFGNTAYAGGASNSAGTYRRDYAGNARADSAGGLTGNALASATSNAYVSPIADACQKNFVIFISNGNPSTGGDSGVSTINTTLGMNQTTITPPSHASTFDEWSRFLYQTDVSALTGKQNVSTYTIGVYDPQNNCTPSSSNSCASNSDSSMIKLMASAARVGGGKSFTTYNYADLANALRQIFIEIQSVNSVFASASLPVSVNAQGTYLNQIFIGMFRPDADALPRWGGNLKQFKFVMDDARNVSLADSLDLLAINPATGFISGCSQSYWTSSSLTGGEGSGYWSFLPLGSCATGDPSDDSPDGEIVEKGGAAQRLRGKTVNSSTGAVTRSVYTYSGSGGSFSDYATGNSDLTAAALGAASAAERSLIINWLRGQDNKDENGNGILNEARPYIHGDVVHSRPLAIDYGGTTGVVVFYGDNVGTFHAVTGEQTASGGQELWAFVPPECYALAKRVRDQSPLVDFWSGSNPFGNSPAPLAKNYCMDGASGVYKDSTKTWIYSSMRRGGRSIYAFNVTNPAQPAFGWRVSSNSTGMSNLGYTWSTPRAAVVNGHVGTPVVLLGGGYDECEDQNAAPNTRCAAKPLGSDVYVLDAMTGAVLKTLTLSGMKSVAADLTLVDTNNDSYVDIAYAVDTGGGVYRIDFLDGGPDAWTIKRIAALGDGLRKFLYAPDVVKSTTTGGVIDHIGIAVGSGDREHPLSTDASASVVNRFYYIKDNGAITTPIVDDDLTDLGQEGGGSTDTTPTINAYGWKLRLRTGEQVVTTPVVVGGVIYFSTNRAAPPETDSCTNNLGEARGYAVSFVDGGGQLAAGARSDTFVGGGLPPSPVVAKVNIGSSTVVTCIGCVSDRNNSAIGATRPPIEVPKTRTRVWWYESAD